MAAHKDILNGKAGTAGKLRKCYHNPNHKVQKGEALLLVQDGLTSKGYCAQCAKAMLDNAEAKVAAIRKALGR